MTDPSASSPTDNLPVTRYTRESPLSHPPKLVAEIVRELWKSRELVSVLFLRDLKAQFRQSYFGYFWLIAPPVMNTAVWLFLNGSNIVNAGDTGMPYPVFVLIGSVFWQSFANGVQQPLKAFSAGKAVFMKLKVPPEAFIAAGSARAVFDFLFSLLLLIPVFFFFRLIPPAQVLLLPVIVVASYLLASAIGVLLVPIGGLYTDVEQAIAMILRFAMFLTPAVYAAPESGLLSTLMTWNPVTPILDSARDCLVLGTGEGWREMLLWMPLTAGGLLVGSMILRVAMPHVVARMGM